MRTKFKIGGVSLLALIFSACGGGENDGPNMSSATLEQYRQIDANAVDSYVVKDNRKVDNCYYDGEAKRPPLATTPKHVKDYRKPQFVYIVETKSGFERRRPIANSAAVQEFQQAVLQGGELTELHQNLQPNMFRAYNYSDNEIAIGAELNRDPNPFDLSLSWYTKLTFVLIHKNDQFSKDKPFRVAVHSNGKISPFYGDSLELKANGKTMTIDYLSMPPGGLEGYDSIANRDCKYYFEIGIDQISTKGGVQMRLPIILDPDGENDESDDPEGNNWPPMPPF